MKKYIFVVSLLCLLAACTGKRQGEAAVEIAALPAVEDVVDVSGQSASVCS